MIVDEKDAAKKGSFRTRIFAFAALLGFATGVGYVGREIYRAATDSFVAPIILSPDNDLVLAYKMKLDELTVERSKTVAEAEAVDADLIAGEKALVRLAAMTKSASDGMAWTKSMTTEQSYAGTLDLRALAQQKVVLGEMVAKQDRLVRDAKANLDATLISRTDFAKEQQTLDQLHIAAIENERTKLQSDLFMRQATLARSSLTSQSGAPLMPEAILREHQLLQVELEQLKIEAEMRTKRAEKRLLSEKLLKIDEIGAQLRARPLFQATTRSIDVAFVPYTQIEGVTKGAAVYDCVLGLLHCKPVGAVAEIVPGEVILPDPWGNQARGQYAILELREHDSAKSKTLRVRGPSSHPLAQTETGIAMSGR